MNKSKIKTLIISMTVALLTASIFLTGCGKAVSKADDEKIHVGMSKDEVVKLLGTPETQSESQMDGMNMEIMHYQSNDGTGGTKAITITILNGRLFDKTWTEL